MTHEVFPSILDNDLYKFTMQNAVFKHYKKDIPVVYQFTNREKDIDLNKEAVEWLQKQINDMEKLKLTEKERTYLSSFPYFEEEYINFLYQYRFKPKEQIKISFDSNNFQLEIVGNWIDTILYEVPLLALISEAYFRFVDQDWSYDGQIEQAAQKTRQLLENKCAFAEFGTRRRRDFKTQDMVVRVMNETFKQTKSTQGSFTGTTHEFFMAISALEGVENANEKTLNIWYSVYQGALGVALTDTFTTPIFLKDFQHNLASQYLGVRHDSGDPMAFADMVVEHYKSIGIDPSTKVIVFSDSLTVDRAVQLEKHAQKLGIKSSFGIGTYLTNDFIKKSDSNLKSKPMNIVIKIKECVGKRVIKLSDDVSKNSADYHLVKAFERELGIEK